MHDVHGIYETLRISQLEFIMKLRHFFDSKLNNHGNEPGHHIPYLFNFVHSYHDTQHYVSQIIEEEYQNSPDGLKGNDDCGQMSAWLILSSLGMYQVSLHQPVFQLTSPLFNRALIRFETNKTLEIVNDVEDRNKGNFVQAAFFNMECLDSPQLSYESIMGGGLLRFHSSSNTSGSSGFSLEACKRYSQKFEQEKR